MSKIAWGWDWDERQFFLLNNSNNSKEHLESPVAIGLPRPSVGPSFRNQKKNKTCKLETSTIHILYLGIGESTTNFFNHENTLW